MKTGRPHLCIIGNFDIQSDTGCWLWNKSTRGGYGLVYRDGRNYQAHRYFYETYIGQVPNGLVVHHKCGNRLCVNPMHLHIVTQQENILAGSGVAANRARQSHCKRGHAFTKANTYTTPAGSRICRTCNAMRNKKGYKKQTEDINV